METVRIVVLWKEKHGWYSSCILPNGSVGFTSEKKDSRANAVVAAYAWAKRHGYKGVEA